MAKKASIGEELKLLGLEMATAFRKMKDSAEFKSLESDIASSVKKVSTSLVKSLKAAQKSEETARLKKRVGRVAKLGKQRGKEEAQKAATAGLKKFNKTFEDLSKKLRSEN